MTDDLAAWLLERITEDERDARNWAAWAEAESGTSLGFELLGLPDRMRAECEAKRKIIKLHEVHEPYDPKAPGGHLPAICLFCTADRDDDVVMPCDHLRFLALPYADRPGYREGWRP